MYDAVMRFAFSPPGLAVWMIGSLYISSFVVLRWESFWALSFSIVTGLLLAIRTTEAMQKRPTYFSRNLQAGRASVTRRFKKYLVSGAIPPQKADFAEYKEFLRATEQIIKNNPPQQKKKTVLLLLVLSSLCMIMPGLMVVGVALLAFTALLARRMYRDMAVLQQLEKVKKRLASARRKG